MKTHVAASAKPSRKPVDTAALRLTPLAAALAAGLFVLPSAANGATIAVVNGGCSLIDAITAANSNTATGLCPAGAGADTITLPAGSTQTLTAVNNSALRGDSGLPIITSNITLAGNGSSIVRDPGAPAFRILGVAAGGSLSLRNTTLSGGEASAFNGVFGGYYGGGLFNEGSATLTDSTVSGNVAKRGGGIHNFTGALTLTRSTVSGNSSESRGGGIFDLAGTTTLTNSTVSGNVSAYDSGGIYTGSATLTLTDSTVSGNSAFLIGGIAANPATLTLSRSLISGNTAVGKDFEVYSSGGTVTANKRNLLGFNGNARVFGFAPGATDVVPAGALATILGPLANNGGPTQTRALVTGSPAIDAAAAACSTTDQRGVNRPKGTACDIGAFELGTNSADLVIAKVESDNSVLVGEGVTFTLTIANFGLENATDVQVFDTLPEEFTFVSATPSQGLCALVLGTLTCDLGNLANGAFAAISLVTTANAPGAINNTASIISSVIDSDPNPTNNSSTASVTIAAIDTAPNQFAFNDVTDVERNLSLTSNTVTVTGINTPAPISVTGGMFSIGCTAIFTNVATTISNAQTVCVKHTSSGSFSTAVNTTLTIGGVSDTYTSTTRAADTTPEPFVFIDQSNTTRNTVRTSNTVTITGIEVPVPISVTGGTYSIGCTGVFTAAASVISSGQTVCVRNTTAPTFNTAVNTKLTVGGTADTFTTVTAPNAAAALLGVVFAVLNGLLEGLFG